MVDELIHRTLYGQIARDFIRLFGRNLPLEQDPDPDIDYTPYKVEDFPEEERQGERFRRSVWGSELESVSKMSYIWSTMCYSQVDVF